MIVVGLTISSKKNQACCRAPSLTLPLLTTHCRASSSWKSWEQEGAIKEPFTIKYTAYRSVCLSSTMGYDTVLWHKVHCVAERVGRIHYSTDPTLNTDKHPIRTQYPLLGQDQQGALYHKWHIIPSSGAFIVKRCQSFIVKRRTETQIPQEHDNHSNKTSKTTSSHSKTDRRRWGEEGVGSCPPGIGSLPFWSASVLLMFARNWRSQCAMTCDCHCAPWPTGGDEWKGDKRLVWRTRVCGAIHYQYLHTDTHTLSPHAQNTIQNETAQPVIL